MPPDGSSAAFTRSLSRPLLAGRAKKFDHPTQKPIELMRRPILNHTRRGELVYEPFTPLVVTFTSAGSGP